MGQFWTKIFKHKDVRILLLGLDGAGKTTLLYRLKLGEVVTHIPTIGFNVEQLTYKNITFTAWDIGARDKMRPLFRHYYKGTDAVVMVIDSSDRERLDELYCDVLKPALHADELANSVFLFLVNKRDLPNTLDKDEVAAKLNLQSIKHIWNIIETSAIQGDGLTDCMDWLALHLGSSSTSTKKPSSQAVHRTYSDSSPSHCDKSTESIKDKSAHRDYCTRAYSAFKCFFIRPNVPPDIAD
ncbi:ADP-ribosylation factor 1-like isoform X3 [Ruditapes philippinarum]|uniref:ADP-ribosylation factor 1-like isoform X1 n=1 Tax=Ruditapes philippinarum TaxID=129788 RepID=UPI00295AD116|nr:ADP-ribosylation factor 1-like isoform X1 [Ruditapes philippinarum]XP_060595578.1 ADP-ribosylation factor 1-like isoform X3 [Ruditapes philippinarum]